MMAIAADQDEQGDFDFVPRTFLYPRDDKKFLAYKKKNDKAIFIAKPPSGLQGDNIALFQTLKQLPEDLKGNCVI